MHLKEFFLSKLFRKHVLGAILLTFILLWLTMLSLSIYTHRGESLAIPDFTGMTMEEATQVAKKCICDLKLKTPYTKPTEKQVLS
jgi:hypothetical protein